MKFDHRSGSGLGLAYEILLVYDYYEDSMSNCDKTLLSKITTTNISYLKLDYCNVF